MKNTLLLSIALLVLIYSAKAQQASYFDPAQSYIKLLLEKNNGSYTRVGNYKVAGTPYLFGENNMGNLFTANESGAAVSMRYNTYNQAVEFLPAPGAKQALVKEPGSLDSFVIKKNLQTGLNDDLFFVYASLLGSKDKAYYQVVSKGKKFNLYKRYNAELGIVSTNYVQADLRQFNLLIDYYYSDSGNTKLKKLKTTPAHIIKEFSSVRDLSTIINADALTSEREKELTKIFQELNRE